MTKKLRNLLILLIIICLSLSPAIASDKIKTVARTNQEFSPENFPNEITFEATKEFNTPYGAIIPEHSTISAEILEAQKELRWHKSGYILCKLKHYTDSTNGEKFDLEDKNIYLAIRRYESVNGKEAAITGTELVVSTSVAMFIPGIDILYFFTKGAIQREKHKNWFKAGVHNAYDNSICWFWLKGKPIDLKEHDTVSIKEIKETRAIKLQSKIKKRKEKKNKKRKNNSKLKNKKKNKQKQK